MFFELPGWEHRTRIGADGPGAANPLKHHLIPLRAEACRYFFRYVPAQGLLGVPVFKDCGRIRFSE
ncbi:hypothetical protein, partial [Kitasatospora purpeofusca]|uniref:hypothetical protein n=1 Tax=Kitasatospora purpeofusca TaxID=67352 RepID=UPI001ABF2D82